jgi:hypothetical protein
MQNNKPAQIRNVSAISTNYPEVFQINSTAKETAIEFIANFSEQCGYLFRLTGNRYIFKQAEIYNKYHVELRARTETPG